MRHPRTVVTGVALGAVLLGIGAAPAASAAVGEFRYDAQTLTDPINGNCYQLTGTASPHLVVNATDTEAFVSTGASCSGPALIQVAPGRSFRTPTDYGSVFFR